ncbi:unnamed protein product [Amoebophrya sp. A120]|nr:unnamed protein product [Amoebophrya sp. A120]|eukprot:GSA120T00025887001.1
MRKKFEALTTGGGGGGSRASRGALLVGLWCAMDFRSTPLGYRVGIKSSSRKVNSATILRSRATGDTTSRPRSRLEQGLKKVPQHAPAAEIVGEGEEGRAGVEPAAENVSEDDEGRARVELAADIVSENVVGRVVGEPRDGREPSFAQVSTSITNWEDIEATNQNEPWVTRLLDLCKKDQDPNFFPQNCWNNVDTCQVLKGYEFKAGSGTIMADFNLWGKGDLVGAGTERNYDPLVGTTEADKGVILARNGNGIDTFYPALDWVEQCQNLCAAWPNTGRFTGHGEQKCVAWQVYTYKPGVHGVSSATTYREPRTAGIACRLYSKVPPGSDQIVPNYEYTQGGDNHAFSTGTTIVSRLGTPCSRDATDFSKCESETYGLFLDWPDGATGEQTHPDGGMFKRNARVNPGDWQNAIKDQGIFKDVEINLQTNEQTGVVTGLPRLGPPGSGEWKVKGIEIGSGQQAIEWEQTPGDLAGRWVEYLQPRGGALAPGHGFWICLAYCRITPWCLGMSAGIGHWEWGYDGCWLRELQPADRKYPVRWDPNDDRAEVHSVYSICSVGKFQPLLPEEQPPETTPAPPTTPAPTTPAPTTPVVTTPAVTTTAAPHVLSTSTTTPAAMKEDNTTYAQEQTDEESDNWWIWIPLAALLLLCLLCLLCSCCCKADEDDDDDDAQSPLGAPRRGSAVRGRRGGGGRGGGRDSGGHFGTSNKHHHHHHHHHVHRDNKKMKLLPEETEQALLAEGFSPSYAKKLAKVICDPDPKKDDDSLPPPKHHRDLAALQKAQFGGFENAAELRQVFAAKVKVKRDNKLKGAAMKDPGLGYWETLLRADGFSPAFAKKGAKRLAKARSDEALEAPADDKDLALWHLRGLAGTECAAEVKGAFLRAATNKKAPLNKNLITPEFGEAEAIALAHGFTPAFAKTLATALTDTKPGTPAAKKKLPAWKTESDRDVLDALGLGPVEKVTVQDMLQFFSPRVQRKRLATKAGDKVTVSAKECEEALVNSGVSSILARRLAQQAADRNNRKPLDTQNLDELDQKALAALGLGGTETATELRGLVAVKTAKKKTKKRAAKVAAAKDWRPELGEVETALKEVGLSPKYRKKLAAQIVSANLDPSSVIERPEGKDLRIVLNFGFGPKETVMALKMALQPAKTKHKSSKKGAAAKTSLKSNDSDATSSRTSKDSARLSKRGKGETKHKRHKDSGKLSTASENSGLSSSSAPSSREGFKKDKKQGKNKDSRKESDLEAEETFTPGGRVLKVDGEDDGYGNLVLKKKKKHQHKDHHDKNKPGVFAAPSIGHSKQDHEDQNLASSSPALTADSYGREARAVFEKAILAQGLSPHYAKKLAKALANPDIDENLVSLPPAVGADLEIMSQTMGIDGTGVEHAQLAREKFIKAAKKLPPEALHHSSSDDQLSDGARGERVSAAHDDDEEDNIPPELQALAATSGFNNLTSTLSGSVHSLPSIDLNLASNLQLGEVEHIYLVSGFSPAYAKKAAKRVVAKDSGVELPEEEDYKVEEHEVTKEDKKLLSALGFENDGAATQHEKMDHFMKQLAREKKREALQAKAQSGCVPWLCPGDREARRALRELEAEIAADAEEHDALEFAGLEVENAVHEDEAKKALVRAGVDEKAAEKLASKLADADNVAQELSEKEKKELKSVLGDAADTPGVDYGKVASQLMSQQADCFVDSLSPEAFEMYVNSKRLASKSPMSTLLSSYGASGESGLVGVPISDLSSKEFANFSPTSSAFVKSGLASDLASEPLSAAQKREIMKSRIREQCNF